MGSTYRLVMQSGPGMGMEYLLDRNELFLGRDAVNDIVINDSEVSRKHARLIMEGATYKLEDLGSTNGTFIRGQRLSAPVLLKPGEVITLGEKIVLRYEVASSDPNATVVAQRGSRQVTQPPVASSQSIPLTPSIPPPPVQSAPAYPPISATPAYPPVSPVPGYPPAVPPKKSSKALVIILIILGALVLLCVIPRIIIDVTNSYCVIMPGILNMFLPGACF